MILVVGSRSSSNSNRLREVAELCGVEAHLIDNAEQIDLNWLADRSHVGITAGASAPEILVQRVIAHLSSAKPGAHVSHLSGVEEHVTFGLPPELKA